MILMLKIKSMKLTCRRTVEGSIEEQEEKRGEGSTEIRGATTWWYWWSNWEDEWC